MVPDFQFCDPDRERKGKSRKGRREERKGQGAVTLFRDWGTNAAGHTRKGGKKNLGGETGKGGV